MSNETETEWETDYWNENISAILKDLEAAEQGRHVSFISPVFCLTKEQRARFTENSGGVT